MRAIFIGTFMNDPQTPVVEQQHTPTRLSLNLTYPALVALIGGDTQAELDIRQQVVNRFAEKYLKPLVLTKEFNEARESLERVVQEKIVQLVGAYKTGCFSRQVVLNPETRQAVEKHAKDSVEELIQSAASKAIEDVEKKYGVRIEEYIQNRVDSYLGTLVRDKMQAKLKALVS
jgi:DNA-binding protein YbaB